MNYVIRFVGLAGIHLGPGPVPRPGDYLVTFDPDAHDGYGDVTWTADWREAKLFGQHKDAFDYWRQQSTVMPTRADGKPNRPLTACSIEVVTLERAMDEPGGILGPDVRSNLWH